MTGKEKEISIEAFSNPIIFDLVMDDVERTKSTYVLCENGEPSVVLMPYDVYESVKMRD